MFMHSKLQSNIIFSAQLHIIMYPMSALSLSSTVYAKTIC